MVSGQFGYEFVATQLATDPLRVALVGALVGLPFLFVAYWVLLIGTLRSEHVESNWWHRAFSFYDEARLGKVLILLSLFAPAMAIIVLILMIFPDDVFHAIFFASVPWALCPFIPLADLKASRMPQSN